MRKNKSWIYKFLNTDFCEKMYGRIRNNRGESLSETLVALLIAALALTMLAGAMSSASNIITKSQKKLEKYNTNEENMISKNESHNSSVSITLNSPEMNVSLDLPAYNVRYYYNNEFGKNPVVLYEQ